MPTTTPRSPSPKQMAAFVSSIMSTSHSVLLDLDGTLIDSQPGIVAGCLAALRALGRKPDEALDVKRFIGPPIEDVMQFLLQRYGDDRSVRLWLLIVSITAKAACSGASLIRELAAPSRKCDKPDCEFI